MESFRLQCGQALMPWIHSTGSRRRTGERGPSSGGGSTRRAFPLSSQLSAGRAVDEEPAIGAARETLSPVDARLAARAGEPHAREPSAAVLHEALVLRVGTARNQLVSSRTSAEQDPLQGRARLRHDHPQRRERPVQIPSGTSTIRSQTFAGARDQRSAPRAERPNRRARAARAATGSGRGSNTVHANAPTCRPPGRGRGSRAPRP